MQCICLSVLHKHVFSTQRRLEHPDINQQSIKIRIIQSEQVLFIVIRQFYTFTVGYWLFSIQFSSLIVWIRDLVRLIQNNNKMTELFQNISEPCPVSLAT